MKHAGPETLATLAPCLDRLRARRTLVERSPGCFYRGGQAFLHFHEDPAGPFADVRLAPGPFTRLRVATAAEGEALVAAVARCLGDDS